MRGFLIASFFLLAGTPPACAQPDAPRWLPQTSGVAVGLRGVSAVSKKVAWVGGDKGTFLRTTNGGRTWQADSVAGASESDFRDVHAVDENTAHLLSSGNLARIYKTTNGGKTWALRYENKVFGAFLDGFAFWDDAHGIAFGDPLGGRFLVVTTSDGGETWRETPFFNVPPALPDEAAFAASGTSVGVQGSRHAWFCTGGGKQARVFRSRDAGLTWETSNLPLTCHSPSSGAFSIAFRDTLHGVVAGGDFLAPNQPLDNFAVTSDGGKTWQLEKTVLPVGLKQCVAYVPGSRRPALLATGESGTGYSTDEGRTWKIIADRRPDAPNRPPYYSISFSRDGKAAWAVGAKGSIGSLDR
ncbi:MAG: hypothetical protein H7Z75_05500 [Ferruginibacter sp.]|nr:hypothetical protein [Cytophagales bacterium]